MNDSDVYVIVTPHVGGGLSIAVWIVVSIATLTIGGFLVQRIYRIDIDEMRRRDYVGYWIGWPLLVLFFIILIGVIPEIGSNVNKAVNQNIEQRLEEDIGLTDILPANNTTGYRDGFFARDSDGYVVKGQVIEHDEPNHYQIRISKY